MPKILFSKGNKLAKGGKREGAGRKSNETKEIESKAAEYARKYLEGRIDKVLGEYERLALGGIKRRKHNPKTGKAYYEREWDTGNQRHWIDKFLPAAKQSLEISGGIKIVKVDAFDPDEKK